MFLITVETICLDRVESVVYKLWMMHLHWLLWSLLCIYSMCKNCSVVYIYNNTACSHCVCALLHSIDVAGVGVALFVCTFIQRRLPPLAGDGICNDGVCVCVCASVCVCLRALIACARLRSDHYDWAASLFSSLSDPAHSKLHRALFHHCA